MSSQSWPGIGGQFRDRQSWKLSWYGTLSPFSALHLTVIYLIPCKLWQQSVRPDSDFPLQISAFENPSTLGNTVLLLLSESTFYFFFFKVGWPITIVMKSAPIVNMSKRKIINEQDIWIPPARKRQFIYGTQKHHKICRPVG